jgi:hypothetical protein
LNPSTPIHADEYDDPEVPVTAGTVQVELTPVNLPVSAYPDQFDDDHVAAVVAESLEPSALENGA